MDENKEVGLNKANNEPVVVTLDVVKSLLSVQHESYRSTIQLFMTQMNEEIREVKKDISDLKMSANFTGKDVKELQDKVEGIEKNTRKLIQESYDVNNEFEILADKHEYLENKSRRNNVKLIGVPESANSESWEESEEIFKENVNSALQIDASVMAIERAHRVGKKGGKKSRNGEVLPRPIVAKFLNWKDREKVLKSAREKRPDGLFFVEDLAQRTLEKREAQKPELARARQEGKLAYFVAGKLIIKDKPPDTRRRKLPSNQSKSDDESEVFIRQEVA